MTPTVRKASLVAVFVAMGLHPPPAAAVIPLALVGFI